MGAFLFGLLSPTVGAAPVKVTITLDATQNEIAITNRAVVGFGTEALRVPKITQEFIVGEFATINALPYYSELGVIYIFQGWFSAKVGGLELTGEPTYSFNVLPSSGTFYARYYTSLG